MGAEKQVPFYKFLAYMHSYISRECDIVIIVIQINLAKLQMYSEHSYTTQNTVVSNPFSEDQEICLPIPEFASCEAACT
jgi:hypothetical protein